MAITINSTTFAKRHNSTAIPASFSHSYDVALKGACSYNRPVFLLAEPAFLDNYIQWGNWYYFVDDVVVVRNNLLEVHCALDVLATYKADILASTQYVAYSNVSGGTWLPDNRIPVLSEREVRVNSFRHRSSDHPAHIFCPCWGKMGVLPMKFRFRRSLTC